MWGYMFRFWRRFLFVVLVLPGVWALLAGIAFAQTERGNTGALVIGFGLAVLALDVRRHVKAGRR